ncbi:hypothetical protein TWF281_004589 [Arthrobotrys megalospora]
MALTDVPKIYARKFTRDPDPHVQDEDDQVDEQFMDKNFTDRFGQLLYKPSVQQGLYAGNMLDQNTLMMYLTGVSSNGTSADYIVQPFAVVDASTIKYDASKLGDWYNPHLRFLYVVTAAADGPHNYYETVTFFVVGSSNVPDPSGFLQCASWDPNVNEFRFYEKVYDTKTKSGYWSYNGKSSDAFNKDTEYLGPFNGHVNGATIMKELEKPWIHWESTDGSVRTCLSPDTVNSYLKYPFLSDETTSYPLSKLGNANDLEQIIKTGVDNWFQQRKLNDFKDGGKYREEPLNVKRWAAHAIMTTTINIINAVEDPAGGRMLPPLSMFINQNAMNEVKIWPSSLLPTVSYTEDVYNKALEGLKIVLMQELVGDKYPPYPEGSIQLKEPGTLGGGRQTDSLDILNFMVAKQGEGKDFTVIVPSYEDLEGINELYGQTVKPNTPALFTPVGLRALVSFDFPNPVYSWRRSVLIDYAPETTKLVGGNSYDFETQFIANIRASHYASQPGSPEAEFLELYQTFETTTMGNRIKAYLNILSRNFKSDVFINKYLQLAETKRRIYRPLPLDEFGYTLPYALGIDQDALWLEMTESGDVQEMDPRGVSFFMNWRNSVSSLDPHLIPQSDPSATTAAVVAGVQNLGLSAGSSSTKKSSGCPYTRRNLPRPSR